MIRPPPPNLTLTLSVLALIACGETPTEPATAGDQSPLAPSFAFASNSWTTRKSLPDRIPRIGLAAGVVNNSTGQPILYVFGGHFQEIESRVIKAYNYATSTWASTGSFFEGEYTNGVGKIGTRLYISGGYDTNGGKGFTRESILLSLYAYDPAADRLTRKADMPRHTADGVTGVINGKLYVLAGTCGVDCANETIRRLYRYDPAMDAWTTTLPWCPRYHANGAGGVINDKFYVAGGHDAGGSASFTTALDVYDPVTNRWKALAPMPSPVGGAAGAVLNNKLYVIGGLGPRGNRSVIAYDPVTNTWQTKASLLTGRSFLAAASLVTASGNPKILAVGGNDGTGGSGRNELYTP